jgi:hypothetical protein
MRKPAGDGVAAGGRGTVHERAASRGRVAKEVVRGEAAVTAGAVGAAIVEEAGA